MHAGFYIVVIAQYMPTTYCRIGVGKSTELLSFRSDAPVGIVGDPQLLAPPVCIATRDKCKGASAQMSRCHHHEYKTHNMLQV